MVPLTKSWLNHQSPSQAKYPSLQKHITLFTDKHCVSRAPSSINRGWINQVQPNKHFWQHWIPVKMATPIQQWFDIVQPKTSLFTYSLEWPPPRAVRAATWQCWSCWSVSLLPWCSQWSPCPSACVTTATTSGRNLSSSTTMRSARRTEDRPCRPGIRTTSRTIPIREASEDIREHRIRFKDNYIFFILFFITYCKRQYHFLSDSL